MQRLELREKPQIEKRLGTVAICLIERRECTVLVAQRHMDLCDADMIHIVGACGGFELGEHAARALGVAAVRVADRGLVVWFAARDRMHHRRAIDAILLETKRRVYVQQRIGEIVKPRIKLKHSLRLL